jgi:phospholipid-binding lipoprotein MlaA
MMRHRSPTRAQALKACVDGAPADARRALPFVAHAAMLIVTMLALGASLAGCAGMAPGQRSGDDPLEPLNRAVFDVNTALDDSLIRPVAEAYRAVVPEFVRDRIRSAIDNLAEPRIFANDVLQGRFNAAGFTFARFFANTIAGVGGLFDFATMHGLAKQTGDFGQTLSAWGVDDGPYVVLLFFGPSNVRDALGLGVDLVTTPPALVVSGPSGRVINVVVGVFDGVDLRSRNIETLDEIRASALDPYAHLKSVTRQYRAAQLREARGLEAAPAELIDPESPPPR